MNKNYELKFGTSGLRGLVAEMTDREVYINTLGFLSFLEETEGESGGRSIALAGDLRASTARIMCAVSRAAEAREWLTLWAGKLPSPALALMSEARGIPGIMVTGSHIPEDRNGIKFTKRGGEILKEDEPLIVTHVKRIRQKFTSAPPPSTLFSEKGSFIEAAACPPFKYEGEATDLYVRRYADFFPSTPLKGVTLVHYEQSAVGRDMVTKVLENLGAKVIRTGRCKNFIPVDTEKISNSTKKVFKQSAEEYSPFAILTTDGDSDRPLLADENGEIIPGDKLGGLATLYLKPDFAALPVTTNEAVVRSLEEEGVHVQMTKIGSPYVIKAMEEARAGGFKKIVGWEANGGFLTGSDWHREDRSLRALCTRDAILPIVSTLILARERKLPLSTLYSGSFQKLYSHADVLDNRSAGMEEYTSEGGKEIINFLSPKEKTTQRIDFEAHSCTVSKEGQAPHSLSGAEVLPLLELERRISAYFPKAGGFSGISSINFIDGIRITFTNDETVHLRPSGNAPEFRVYAFATTRRRAEEIVEKRYRIIPKIFSDLKAYTK